MRTIYTSLQCGSKHLCNSTADLSQTESGSLNNFLHVTQKGHIIVQTEF